MKIKDKVIVVTGGGSGMGRELALQLLSRGAKVAIADINEQGMKETAALAGDLSSNLSIHLLNIADKEKVAAFPQVVIDRHGAVDGIINNAGIIQPFIDVNDLDFERIERILQVNFYGTLYMVKAFLPHLLQRPEAHIANVSSMGGFIPFPGQTFYGASKAAVKLLSEGLFAELQHTNVHVTVIFPGAVNTNITTNSGVAMSNTGNTEDFPGLQPDEAARIMIDGIESDKFRVLAGKDARFLDFMYRLSPKRAVRFIVKQMKSRLAS
ncbi:MAG: SDR family NAD(P)-dependent oxidoreductase [Phaeodactylibacter sp.]|nr:SDR family NAD(P)-dependent oxidoreductase [Phaeodactylibacter sp.]